MHRDISRRSRRLVIGILVFVTMAGGVAFASILKRGNQSPQLPQPSGAPGNYNSEHRVIGRGLTSAQAVAQVLADFAGTPVRNITVGSAKLRDGPTDPAWLTVEVVGVDPNGVEATWLEVLAPEAVANLMSHGEPTTKAVTRGGQQFASPSDDLLRLRVHNAASKFGLEVRKLTILHPLDSAVSVSFTVPDNATVSWTIDQLRAAVEGSPRTLEGSLIKLYSTSGELLLSSGVAYRTGLGGLSFAAGQDERFHAVHSYPALPSRVISTP
jgi:hypothetical protein